MANINSKTIIDVNSSTLVSISTTKFGGRVYASSEIVDIDRILAVDDTVMLTRIPTKATIRNVYFSCTDFGSAGAIDIGVFKGEDTDVEGVVPIKRDLFVSDLNISTSSILNKDLRYERLSFATMNDNLFKLSGSTETHSLLSYSGYDVGLTVKTATTATSGQMGIVVIYVTS